MTTRQHETEGIKDERTTRKESSPRIQWQWSAFDELTPRELYAVMRLRQIVFVVEQECAYLDADGYDARAWHLLGWLQRDGEKWLGAYARIFAPGIKYTEASIGRVITHPDLRGTGKGKELMREAIRRTLALTNESSIKIGAQMRLEKFYEEFDFRRTSEMYMEDGIPHIEMIRRKAEGEGRS